MGGHPGRPLRRAHEVAQAPADAGGRIHIHQRGEEHHHNGSCSDRSDRRPDDTRGHARRAVYHRAAQLPRGAVHVVHLFAAGRAHIAGAHQRDSLRQERGAGLRAGHRLQGGEIHRHRQYRLQV